MTPPPGPKGRKQPKPVTRERLERIAVFYLERFSASAEGLRQVLRRRVEQAARIHETDRDQAELWIGEVVEKLARAGFIDDHRFAEGKARSLFRKGDPPTLIRRTLAAKGVDSETIETALSETLEHSEDPDMEAAQTYCKRRKLGPYRTDPGTREARYRKDLGSLARRGFSSAVAHRILGAEDGGEEWD
ncbi:MAG: RecX family transcriptional regulator [Rhodospirillum sp.]|nr:RecX family transcriptional regulator [Rhodospirillum sp.]MCF8488689.1 RecX family transcriptional regulator [Rhodospirillum sp.]MCF8501551.1 RecX family transcriptional regulator [Rhodospirillum sp.]